MDPGGSCCCSQQDESNHREFMKNKIEDKTLLLQNKELDLRQTISHMESFLSSHQSQHMCCCKCYSPDIPKVFPKKLESPVRDVPKIIRDSSPVTDMSEKKEICPSFFQKVMENAKSILNMKCSSIHPANPLDDQPTRETDESCICDVSEQQWSSGPLSKVTFGSSDVQSYSTSTTFITEDESTTKNDDTVDSYSQELSNSFSCSVSCSCKKNSGVNTGTMSHSKKDDTISKTSESSKFFSTDTVSKITNVSDSTSQFTKSITEKTTESTALENINTNGCWINPFTNPKMDKKTGDSTKKFTCNKSTCPITKSSTSPNIAIDKENNTKTVNYCNTGTCPSLNKDQTKPKIKDVDNQCAFIGSPILKSADFKVGFTDSATTPRKSSTLCCCCYSGSKGVFSINDDSKNAKRVEELYKDSSSTPRKNSTPCCCTGNKSIFSITGKDSNNAKTVEEFATREKEIKVQMEDLQQREKNCETLYENLQRLMATSNCCCTNKRKPDATQSEIGKVSQELKLENKILKTELMEMKLELKHCLEKIEGPMKHKLETEKSRCVKLEQELSSASKDMMINQDNHLREMNSLKLQLCVACSNITEMNAINKRLRDEMTSLDCMCVKLEDDLVKHKLSEAETIKRLTKRTPDIEEDSPKLQVEQMIQEAFKCDSNLNVIARKLSKTLKDIAPCEECAKLPAELAGAAKCIKDLTDLVESRKLAISKKSLESVSEERKDGSSQSHPPTEDGSCQCVDMRDIGAGESKPAFGVDFKGGPTKDDAFKMKDEPVADQLQTVKSSYHSAQGEPCATPCGDDAPCEKIGRPCVKKSEAQVTAATESARPRQLLPCTKPCGENAPCESKGRPCFVPEKETAKIQDERGDDKNAPCAKIGTPCRGKAPTKPQIEDSMEIRKPISELGKEDADKPTEQVTDIVPPPIVDISEKGDMIGERMLPGTESGAEPSHLSVEKSLSGEAKEAVNAITESLYNKLPLGSKQDITETRKSLPGKRTSSKIGEVQDMILEEEETIGISAFDVEETFESNIGSSVQQISGNTFDETSTVDDSRIESTIEESLPTDITNIEPSAAILSSEAVPSTGITSDAQKVSSKTAEESYPKDDSNLEATSITPPKERIMVPITPTIQQTDDSIIPQSESKRKSSVKIISGSYTSPGSSPKMPSKSVLKESKGIVSEPPFDEEITGTFPFDATTKVEILEEPPADLLVTTTITSSGTLEVITEAPGGIVETTLNYREDGTIEVITQIIEDVSDEPSGLGIGATSSAISDTTGQRERCSEDSKRQKGSKTCSAEATAITQITEDVSDEPSGLGIGATSSPISEVKEQPKRYSADSRRRKDSRTCSAEAAAEFREQRDKLMRQSLTKDESFLSGDSELTGLETQSEYTAKEYTVSSSHPSLVAKADAAMKTSHISRKDDFTESQMKEPAIQQTSFIDTSAKAMGTKDDILETQIESALQQTSFVESESKSTGDELGNEVGTGTIPPVIRDQETLTPTVADATTHEKRASTGLELTISEQSYDIIEEDESEIDMTAGVLAESTAIGADKSPAGETIVTDESMLETTPADGDTTSYSVTKAELTEDGMPVEDASLVEPAEVSSSREGHQETIASGASETVKLKDMETEVEVATTDAGSITDHQDTVDSKQLEEKKVDVKSQESTSTPDATSEKRVDSTVVEEIDEAAGKSVQQALTGQKRDCACQSSPQIEQSCQCCECKDIGVSTSPDSQTITDENMVQSKLKSTVQPIPEEAEPDTQSDFVTVPADNLQSSEALDYAEAVTLTTGQVAGTATTDEISTLKEEVSTETGTPVQDEGTLKPESLEDGDAPYKNVEDDEFATAHESLTETQYNKDLSDISESTAPGTIAELLIEGKDMPLEAREDPGEKKDDMQPDDVSTLMGQQNLDPYSRDNRILSKDQSMQSESRGLIERDDRSEGRPSSGSDTDHEKQDKKPKKDETATKKSRSSEVPESVSVLSDKRVKAPSVELSDSKRPKKKRSSRLEKVECTCPGICQCVVCSPEAIARRKLLTGSAEPQGGQAGGVLCCCGTSAQPQPHTRQYQVPVQPQVYMQPTMPSQIPIPQVQHPPGCHCLTCRCTPCTPCPPQYASPHTETFLRSTNLSATQDDPSNIRNRISIEDVFTRQEAYQVTDHQKPPLQRINHPPNCECVDCLCLPKIQTIAEMKEYPIVKDEKQIFQVHTMKCVCINAINAKKYLAENSKIPIATNSTVGPPKLKLNCTCEKCLCTPCSDPEKGTKKADNTTAAPTTTPGNLKLTNSQLAKLCDCKECNCEVCFNKPPKKAADAQKPESTTDQTESKKEPMNKNCCCKEACTCEVCPIETIRQSTEASKMSKQPSTLSHPEDCDCVECTCPNKPGSPKGDVTVGEASQPDDHEEDCDCEECLCPNSPTAKKPDIKGTGDQSEVPEDCDCDTCTCPGVASQQDQLKSMDPTAAKAAIAECDCQDCQCNPCADPKRRRPSGPKPAVPCDCIDCQCQPCADPSKRKEKGDGQAEHPEECTCDECKCKEEFETAEMASKISKTTSVSTKIPHPEECDCPDCLCIEEIIQTESAGVGSTENRETHQPDCICDECLCALGEKHEKGCVCPECVCMDCYYKKDTAIHAPQCKCDECFCIECARKDLNAPKGEGEGEKKVIFGSDGCTCDICNCTDCYHKKSKPISYSECKCGTCLCADCPHKKASVENKTATLVIPTSEPVTLGPGCHCIDCLCDVCSDETKQKKKVPDQSTGNDCTCLVCLCIDCKGKKPQETGTVDELPPPGDRKLNCKCPNCVCTETCFEEGNAEPQTEICHCSTCKCTDCLKKREANVQAAVTHPDDCKCAGCLCKGATQPGDAPKEAEGVVFTDPPPFEVPVKKSCDCKPCDCIICVEKENAKKSQPATDEAPPFEIPIRQPCTCHDCKCDECNKSGHVTVAKEGVTQTLITEISSKEAPPFEIPIRKPCDCSECRCEVCNKEGGVKVLPAEIQVDTPTVVTIMTQKSIASTRPQSAPEPSRPQSPLHCNCPTCTCPDRPAASKSTVKVAQSDNVRLPTDIPEIKEEPPNEPSKEVACVNTSKIQMTEVKRPETCKCAPCTCSQGNIQENDVRGGDTLMDKYSEKVVKVDEPNKTEIVHAPNCSCTTCKCASIIMNDTSIKQSDKEIQDEKSDLNHKPNCDCPNCACIACPDPNIANSQQQTVSKSSKEIQPSVTEKERHTPACICPECCACPAKIEKGNVTKLDKETLMKKNQTEIVHATNCSCTTCKCASIIMNGTSIKQSEKEIQDKKSDLNHKPNCDCPNCACIECPDPNIAKSQQQTVSKSSKEIKPSVTDKERHAQSCVCPECCACPAKTDGIDVTKLDNETLMKKIQTDRKENCECREQIKEIRKALNKIKCSCTEAEMKAMKNKPLVKQASAFGQTMSGLKLALKNLQEKCKAKDQMIEVMTGELKLRTSSVTFDKVLNTAVGEVPDYDKADDVKSLERSNHQPSTNVLYPVSEEKEIAATNVRPKSSEFDSKMTKAMETEKGHKTKKKSKGCKCSKPHKDKDCTNIDLTGFEIVDIRRITLDSIIIKWKSPKTNLVTGYDIFVNGVNKSKVMSGGRTSAMIHSLDLSATIQITIYAVTKCRRCEPPAIAIYEINS